MKAHISGDSKTRLISLGGGDRGQRARFPGIA